MLPINPRTLSHLGFAVFIAVYVSLLGAQLGHGLASQDAHAIIRVSRQFAEQQRMEVSRPPGHPTTEIYLYPGAAWLLRHVFNRDFDEQAYLVIQGAAGLAALCLFYRLLCRVDGPPWRALVAAICLGLSPQFFAHAVDGEEFVFAVFFLTAAFYLLVSHADRRPSGFRLFIATLSFGLATGCRPEVIFAGFLIPLYALLHPKGGWKSAGALLVEEICAVVLIWLPIVWIGLKFPYPAGMNVRESILGGGYRLAFQSFTLPVALLIIWVLVRSLADWRQRTAAQFPQNFLFIVCGVAPIIFFAALFLHASKPAHVLFALPFVLVLATQRSGALLITWALMTVLGWFVTIDIFRDRQLSAPRLVAGSYFKATRQKPFYRLDYLQEVIRQCGPQGTAVFADLWSWDFEYHLARGSFAGREGFPTTSECSVPAFAVVGQADCILYPRDGALCPTTVESLYAHGYALKMDALLYRTLFSRYDISGSTPGTGQIGTANLELFAPKRE